jgi:two-component system chemotaxis sensor kinase CheA
LARGSIDAPALAALAQRLAGDASATSGTAASAPAAGAAPSDGGPTITGRDDAAPTETTARIANDKLDALVAHAGELRVAVRRLERIEATLRELAQSPKPPTTRQLHQLAQLASSSHRAVAQEADRLHDSVHAVRLLPFVEATRGLERAARDIARERHKTVALEVHDRGAELDRSVLSGLREPLLHLVRNAVDHGLEPPDARRDAGKPATGRVVIEAEARGGAVEVRVRDDGRGLDLPAVRAALARRGERVPDDATALMRAIFEPGLSTSNAVTDVSGRGLGLDIVRTRIEAMRGTVEVESQAGYGTQFTLRVPVSLATLRAVIVRAGGQPLALPTQHVRSLMRVRVDALRSVEGRQSVLTDGAPLPVASLGATLELPGAALPGRDFVPLAICAAGGRAVAFGVDELSDESELTVRALPPRLAGLRRVVGSGRLPDGEVVLIVNVPELVQLALSRPGAALTGRHARTSARKRRVLLADDSLTTRSLERSILESAGYDVMPAADGAEAWRILQERGADVIVSDLEMPHLDGIGLLEAVRGSPRYRELPFILVTGRESEEDRTRGLRLGASAYLVKSGFDQTMLLDTIAQLVRD